MVIPFSNMPYSLVRDLCSIPGRLAPFKSREVHETHYCVPETGSALSRRIFSFIPESQCCAW